MGRETGGNFANLGNNLLVDELEEGENFVLGFHRQGQHAVKELLVGGWVGGWVRRSAYQWVDGRGRAVGR